MAGDFERKCKGFRFVMQMQIDGLSSCCSDLRPQQLDSKVRLAKRFASGGTLQVHRSAQELLYALHVHTANTMSKFASVDIAQLQKTILTL